MAQHRHEERIRKMLTFLVTQRHDDADNTGALGPKPLGHLVGAETMLLGQRLDAGLGVGLDQRAVGQGARDGRRIHPGDLGQVSKSADAS
jgi:hypothetical protein